MPLPMTIEITNHNDIAKSMESMHLARPQADSPRQLLRPLSGTSISSDWVFDANENAPDFVTAFSRR